LKNNLADIKIEVANLNEEKVTLETKLNAIRKTPLTLEIDGTYYDSRYIPFCASCFGTHGNCVPLQNATIAKNYLKYICPTCGAEHHPRFIGRPPKKPTPDDK
jgi:hypothetical protein